MLLISGSVCSCFSASLRSSTGAEVICDGSCCADVIFKSLAVLTNMTYVTCRACFLQDNYWSILHTIAALFQILVSCLLPTLANSMKPHKLPTMKAHGRLNVQLIYKVFNICNAQHVTLFCT